MPDVHAADNSPARQSSAAKPPRSPDVFSSKTRGEAGTRKRSSMDSLDTSEQENSRAAANKRHSSACNQPPPPLHDAAEDDDAELLELLRPDAPPPATQAVQPTRYGLKCLLYTCAVEPSSTYGRAHDEMPCMQAETIPHHEAVSARRAGSSGILPGGSNGLMDGCLAAQAVRTACHHRVPDKAMLAKDLPMDSQDEQIRT